MKTQRFTVLIERDEDGMLVATVPALKNCYTQARTMEELVPRVREVIGLCLEFDEPISLELVGVQQIEVPLPRAKRRAAPVTNSHTSTSRKRRRREPTSGRPR